MMELKDKEDLINAYELKHDCSVCGLNFNTDRGYIELSILPNKSMRVVRISEHDAENYIEQMRLIQKK